MKQNAALAGFIARFQGILDAFDEFDALEEINAEFEDSLFFMESIDTESEEAAEEIGDLLDELEALCGDYRDAASGNAEQTEILQQFEMAVEMARQNLL